MTESNDAAPLPHAPAQPTPSKAGRPRVRWLRPLALAGIVVGGVALAAGGVAATTGGDGMGWREGMRLAFAQHAVTRALDSVGATAAQEAKVHDIVAARFAEIAPNPDEHAAMRKEALALLAAPTVDRAAVEKMRLEAVAKFDAKSKAFVAGLLDIAAELTPEQRTKLAARFEAMPPRGPMGGAMGGPMGGPWGPWGGHRGPGGQGPMMGGPGGGPDDGPGGGPDRN